MQRGTLFTEDFLREGIRGTSDWQEFDAPAFQRVHAALKEIIAPFEAGAVHNEADTEERIIYPVLGALGWSGLILRRNALSAKRSEDVPDAVLFPNLEALARA